MSTVPAAFKECKLLPSDKIILEVINQKKYEYGLREYSAYYSNNAYDHKTGIPDGYRNLLMIVNQINYMYYNDLTSIPRELFYDDAQNSILKALIDTTDDTIQVSAFLSHNLNNNHISIGMNRHQDQLALPLYELSDYEIKHPCIYINFTDMSKYCETSINPINNPEKFDKIMRYLFRNMISGGNL